MLDLRIILMDEFDVELVPDFGNDIRFKDDFNFNCSKEHYIYVFL